MIAILIKFLQRLAQALDKLAQREAAKAEENLKQAAELVARANEHRKTFGHASRTASALKDLVS
ncbi:hypothetical protein [Cupriavidus taiwanensis]|uniref:hypothetical protein n=1 Tax=Cupriavidus taiwanensis TaxID=164546 RepID=UPI000E10BADA|nr:hypothetical protein [Cupriavidus taiwanensis]SPA50583.1 protein of unknown function [Cupriavidus taiwanensis]